MVDVEGSELVAEGHVVFDQRHVAVVELFGRGSHRKSQEALPGDEIVDVVPPVCPAGREGFLARVPLVAASVAALALDRLGLAEDLDLSS